MKHVAYGPLRSPHPKILELPALSAIESLPWDLLRHILSFIGRRPRFLVVCRVSRTLRAAVKSMVIEFPNCKPINAAKLLRALPSVTSMRSDQRGITSGDLPSSLRSLHLKSPSQNCYCAPFLRLTSLTELTLDFPTEESCEHAIEILMNNVHSLTHLILRTRNALPPLCAFYLESAIFPELLFLSIDLVKPEECHVLWNSGQSLTALHLERNAVSLVQTPEFARAFPQGLPCLTVGKCAWTGDSTSAFLAAAPNIRFLSLQCGVSHKVVATVTCVPDVAHEVPQAVKLLGWQLQHAFQGAKLGYLMSNVSHTDFQYGLLPCTMEFLLDVLPPSTFRFPPLLHSVIIRVPILIDPDLAEIINRAHYADAFGFLARALAQCVHLRRIEFDFRGRTSLDVPLFISHQSGMASFVSNAEKHPSLTAFVAPRAMWTGKEEEALLARHVWFQLLCSDQDD